MSETDDTLFYDNIPDASPETYRIIGRRMLMQAHIMQRFIKENGREPSDEEIEPFRKKEAERRGDEEND